MSTTPGTGDEVSSLLEALCERARRARKRRSERDYPTLDEVLGPLERFVRRHLAANEAQRAADRAFTRGSFDLGSWLLWAAGHWAREFAAHGDPLALDLGLAALSIEDKQLDHRDTQLGFSLLWHRAVRRGHDPRPHFERAASMASSGPEGMASFLRGFESSACFREDVQPYLTAEVLACEPEADDAR